MGFNMQVVSALCSSIGRERKGSDWHVNFGQLIQFTIYFRTAAPARSLQESELCVYSREHSQYHTVLIDLARCFAFRHISQLVPR